MEVWPHYGDDGRSGAYQVSGVPDEPKVAWVARTDTPVVASPLIAGDTLLAADVSGVLYAFDVASGEPRWRRAVGEGYRDGRAEFMVAPDVWNSWVFVDLAGGDSSVFDVRTGELVRKLDDHGSPTVFGDLLLLNTLNEVRALGLPDMRLRWRATNASGWVQASPAISAEGMAYAALGLEANHTHTGVAVLDLNTGELVRSIDPGRLAFPAQPSVQDDEHDDEFDEDWYEEEQVAFFAQAHAVLAEGRVWMPAYCGEDLWTAQIVGLDPRTGEQVWSYLPDIDRDNEVDSAVAVLDGTLFLVEILRDVASDEDNARLHAVDIASGRARWIRPFGSCAGSPVLAGGVVYVASRTGTVSAFDAVTGEPCWTAETGANVLHPGSVDEFGNQYHEHGLAVLPGDGILYVRTNDGVVALR